MPATVDMPTREDWELLGLRHDACVGDVRAAWRRLSRQTHPDAGGTDALFRRVTEAYERVLADVEYRDRNGPRRHAASENVTPESPSADAETHGHQEWEATTGPDAQERPGSRARSKTRIWLRILVGPGKCAVTTVLAVLACAAVVTWQVLKLTGRVVRFVACAGSWPSSIGGVLALLMLALVAGWAVAHLLVGRAGAVLQDLPVAVTLVRVVGTPWRKVKWSRTVHHQA